MKYEEIFAHNYEEKIRADERVKVIDEIIHKCSKEYQAWGDDTICKIWLSDLEQLKEH